MKTFCEKNLQDFENRRKFATAFASMFHGCVEVKNTFSTNHLISNQYG